MQIKIKQILLLLALAAVLPLAGFSHSVSPNSVPGHDAQSKPVYRIAAVTAPFDIPSWWIRSDLEYYYGDEYMTLVILHYTLVFDDYPSGFYNIEYKVSVWDSYYGPSSNNYWTNASAGNLEVDLGVHEQYYQSGMYFRDTELSVTSITE